MTAPENKEGSNYTEELFELTELFLKNYGEFKRLYSEGISLRSQRAQKCIEIGSKLVAKAMVDENGKPIYNFEVKSSIGNVVISVNHDKVYYTCNKCDPSLTFIQDETRVVYKNIVKVMKTLDPILHNLDFFGQTYNKVIEQNEMIGDGLRKVKSELQHERLRSEELESEIQHLNKVIDKKSRIMKSLEHSNSEAEFRYYIASAISFLSLCGFGYVVIV